MRREIPCRNGTVLFNGEQEILVTECSYGWLAKSGYFGISSIAKEQDAAIMSLGSAIAKEALFFVRTPSHQLSDELVKRKGLFIGAIDILNSDIGLKYATHRWLVGRIEGDHFVPIQSDIDPVELPTKFRREEGIFFARVPVYRDGYPSGPVEELLQNKEEES